MWVRWSALLAMIACGPTVGGAGDGSSSTDASTGSTTSAEEVTSVAATGGPGDPGTTSTGEPVPGTTSGSSSSSSESSSTGCAEEEPKLCGPPGDETNYSLAFDVGLVGDESIDVEVDCSIDAITVEGAEDIVFAFACDDGTHQLEVHSDPPVDLGLAVGDALQLRAARNYPVDSGGYHLVALRDDAGELVVAGYLTFHAVLPPEVDPASFYTPLEFTSVDMGCEPVPYDPPGCGSTFVVDPCATDNTRLGAAFTLGDRTVELWSGTVGTVGDLRVRANVTLLDPVGSGDCPFTEPYTNVSWTALRPAT